MADRQCCIFNALVKAETKQAAISLEQVVRRLSHHVKPGSLVYIISDFRGINQSVENDLAKLARHCELVMILVYDPGKSFTSQGSLSIYR